MDGGRAQPPNQGGTGPIIVFDWDCTITATHMFKVLSGWEGYCEPFSAWCVEQGIDDPLRIPVRESICERMEFGGGAAGLAALKKVFVTFFMGGEERMAQVKAALTTLKHTHGCRLCVLTRGDTASLRIVFDKVLDESWAELFEGGWIANTFNDYFTCSGTGALSATTPGLTSIGREGDGSKESIIEAVFPFTDEVVMLVDDSISRGSILAATSAPGNHGGSISLLDLPMEKDGLDATSIALLLSLVDGDGGLAELSAAKAQGKDPSTLAGAGAGGIKTTIASSGGEFLYVGSNTLDPRRRHALTWIGGGAVDGPAGQWELIPAEDLGGSPLFRVRNVGEQEFLYVGSNTLPCGQRRRVLNWIGGGNVEGSAGVWEVCPIGGSTFKLRNHEKGEYLYVGSSSLDASRRLALTWIGGGEIEGDAGLWRIPGLRPSDLTR